MIWEQGFVSSVDEEHSSAGQGGEGVSHLADSGVVDESSEEEQETWKWKKKTKTKHKQYNPW